MKTSKLLSSIEVFVKFAQQTTEQGPTVLYFNNAQTQDTFKNALGKVIVKGEQATATGPIAKILLDYYNKKQVPVSFSFDATAGDGKAFLTIEVQPKELRPQVMKKLEELFLSITGRSMAQAQKNAEEKVKEGYGSSPIHVFDLDLS